MAADWHLAPGTVIKRTELQARYGGSPQGGIAASAQSPNIFLFSDPARGVPHGYIDGPGDGGSYYYTGEGQLGDQRLTRGNAAILNAVRDNKAIRLFEAADRLVRYRGRFWLDEAHPYTWEDAPESGGASIRTVVVFRLLSEEAATAVPSAMGSLSSETFVEQVSIEEKNAEKFFVEPSRTPYTAERIEAQLVHRFMSFMLSQKHDVHRFKIKLAGELKPIFTDLYVKDLNLLLEAKGTVDRPSIRMAIGQLIDYRRHITPEPRCCVLLPSLPRTDLVDLIKHANMEIAYEGKNGFVFLAERTQPGI